MQPAYLLFNLVGGEPILILSGYSEQDVKDYVAGRKAAGTGDFGYIEVPMMQNPREEG